MKREGMSSPILPSNMSMNTFNPIRQVVDAWNIPNSVEKPLIPLSIGDPTRFPNLPLPNIEEHIIKSVKSAKFNGYPPSVGLPLGAEAVANTYSTQYGVELTKEDVILTSGASHALDIVLSTLCNPGDEILIPKPGFSLYRTICGSFGFRAVEYTLNPEKKWEIDLAHCETLVSDKTKAIVMNNPSNPCGSVFSKEHLHQIVEFAEKYSLPIVADEIYGDIVFSGEEFVPIARISRNVPVFVVSGLAKQYLVPGWRLGWVTIVDRSGCLELVRKGLFNTSQRILGPNSLVQSALPGILCDTRKEFYQELRSALETNARYCMKRLEAIRGLSVIAPQGAMYVMVFLTKASLIF